MKNLTIVQVDKYICSNGSHVVSLNTHDYCNKNKKVGGNIIRSYRFRFPRYFEQKVRINSFLQLLSYKLIIILPWIHLIGLANWMIKPDLTNFQGSLFEGTCIPRGNLLRPVVCHKLKT